MQKINDAYVGFVDPTTGEYATYILETKWHTGAPMDDTLVDGVIYRKHDGKYYKRVLPDGRANLAWWGVKAAKWGEPTEDIYDAFHDAIKAIGVYGRLYIPGGYYHSSGTLVLRSFGGTVEGEPTFGGENATRISFPATTDGMHIKATEYFPGTNIIQRGNATVRYLILQGAGKNDDTPIPGDPNGRYACGILATAVCKVHDVGIGQFGGTGLIVYAEIGGGDFNSQNVSLSSFIRVTIGSCGQHGVWTVGPDANQCYFEQIDVRDNGLCGIFEASFLGNMYMACHANNNGTYPYRVADHGNNRSVFFGCYSEGDGDWPVPGEEQTSDFGTENPKAWIIGGLHGQMPHGGKYLAESADNILFAGRYNTNPSRFFFESGKFDISTGRYESFMGGNDYKIRITTPKENVAFKNRGSVIHIGRSLGKYDVDPIMSFHSLRSHMPQVSSEDVRRGVHGNFTALRLFNSLVVGSRRIAISGTEDLNNFLNSPYGDGEWGQWIKGDIIFNGSQNANKKIFAWECDRSGVLRRSNTLLEDLGTVTGSGNTFVFDDTGLELDDVLNVLVEGDTVRIVGGDNMGIVESVEIDGNDKVKVTVIEGSFSGTGYLEWVAPHFRPITMPGYLDPDRMPPEYVDESAAISAGLENGDMFTIGTALHVVKNKT